MYRAFFSIPASVTDVEGRPANALHGYLDMTARLVSAHRPDDVVHVYDDDWKPAPRVRAYAGYKAHRLPDPEGLPEQFGVLRQVLDAFGLPQAEAPGWEAEDAIGGLSARAGRGDHIDVVTGDRDLIQLVRDPQVRVLFTVRGVTEVRVLVEAYPSLEAMVEDAKWSKEGMSPLRRSASLRAAVRDAAGYLEAMRLVVPIRTDVEVRAWRAERDEAHLGELAERYRLTGPVRRLREALSQERPSERR